MFKKIIGTITVMLAMNAFAATPDTISDLAANADTKALFQKMVKEKNLPKWVRAGGTDSATQGIIIKGDEYQVYSSCKPHQCGLEQVAVLYSAKARVMAGLYAKNSELGEKQTLLWLNVPNGLSIDGKTILFAALTGSLGNHQDWFGKP